MVKMSRHNVALCNYVNDYLKIGNFLNKNHIKCIFRNNVGLGLSDILRFYEP